MDITPFLGLKDRDLKKEGFCIAEGRYVVQRAIEARWTVLGLLCTPANLPLFQGRGFPVMVKSHKEMEGLLGFPFHRGVIAACRRPDRVEAKDYLILHREVKNLVILPATNETENLGSIIRSAAAFGIDALLTGKECCDPLSRKGIRSSMGNVFTLPLLEWEDDRGLLDFLKSAGFKITGTSLEEPAINLKEYEFGEKNALVFGNEARGLSSPWDTAERVTIPMARGVDSLNVGVAAGILFYQMMI